jgi:hypothetical protein
MNDAAVFSKSLTGAFMCPGLFPLMKHPILRRRESMPESSRAWKDNSNKRLAQYGVIRASFVLIPREMLSKLVTFFKKLPWAGSLTCVLALKKIVYDHMKGRDNFIRLPNKIR